MGGLESGKMRRTMMFDSQMNVLVKSGKLFVRLQVDGAGGVVLDNRGQDDLGERQDVEEKPPRNH